MPRNTTSSMLFYTYVLESMKDGERYIGYTEDLRRRIKEDAKRRERYLHRTQGRRFLGLRLLEYTRRKKALGTGS